MFVLVGIEARYDVIVIGRIVLAELLCIDRVGHSYDSDRFRIVLAELLCIDRVGHSYDSDRFCHINTVLLIVN